MEALQASSKVIKKMQSCQKSEHFCDWSRLYCTLSRHGQTLGFIQICRGTTNECALYKFAIGSLGKLKMQCKMQIGPKIEPSNAK